MAPPAEALRLPLQAPVREPSEEALHGDPMFHEPLHRIWGRRALTLSALLVFAVTATALIPFLLAYSLVSDIAHRRRALLTRFYLCFYGVVMSHFLGLGLELLFWLGSFKWLGLCSPERWERWNSALESWWSDKTIGLARRLYNVRFETDGLDLVAPGPVLLLSRHASVIDTIIPAMILGRAHRMTMRIVIKWELIYDPAVEVIARRLPRAFVRRGSHDHKAQLEACQALLRGADENDAVLVFPEGTRFTEEKKSQVIARLAHKNPAAARLARELRHVLPPRPAGTFAMIDYRPDMDVVFCAHTGLEGAHRLENLISGVLLDRTVKIKYWRVPAADIPVDLREREVWLERWWRRIDDWIDENRAP